MNNIYHDLEAIKSVAVAHTKDDGYNYNIILHNPNDKGEFDLSLGSTYEFVMDSYFNTPRPNVILICKTKDLLQVEDTQRLIDSFSPDAPHMKMRQEFQRMDAEMQYAKNSEEGAGSKLKEGLSVVHAEPDGVTYKQGRLVWSA